MLSLEVSPDSTRLDASAIIGANVQSHYWHDDYHFQTFTGKALDIRESCFGPVVLFVPDENQRNLPYTLPARWLPISYVTGIINPTETQTTPAFAEVVHS